MGSSIFTPTQMVYMTVPHLSVLLRAVNKRRTAVGAPLDSVLSYAELFAVLVDGGCDAVDTTTGQTHQPDRAPDGASGQMIHMPTQVQPPSTTPHYQLDPELVDTHDGTKALASCNRGQLPRKSSVQMLNQLRGLEM